MIFGFGKDKKKLRLIDSARLAIENIVEGTGLSENDGFWENSYVSGFLYSLSLEAIKYENNDVWDEDCMEAWTDYWITNYPYIFSLIRHFSSMEADEELDKEVPINQKLINDFNKGTKFGRTSLLIRTGRHSTVDEGVKEAIESTEKMIDEGIAPKPQDQTEYNQIVCITFTKFFLIDYRNNTDNFE